MGVHTAMVFMQDVGTSGNCSRLDACPQQTANILQPLASAFKSADATRSLNKPSAGAAFRSLVMLPES